MEALGDLARGSAVVREKAELSKLEANIEVAVAASSSEISKAFSGEAKGEGSMSISNLVCDLNLMSCPCENVAKNLQTVLTNMVENLRIQIDTTEKVKRRIWIEFIKCLNLKYSLFRLLVISSMCLIKITMVIILHLKYQLIS